MDFGRWYTDTRDELVASLGRSIADGDRAEEAVAEAFTRAWERWETVATLESPTGWIYTVALNVARRTYRRSAQETDRLLQLDDDDGHTPDNGIDHLLDDLPPRQREAVRLRIVDAYTEQQIADHMGVTRSTVSSTLRAAHQTLASSLRTPEGPLMHLRLARVRSGHDDGCVISYLDADITERVPYSAAVRDSIRIRRNDLVAIDTSTSPPQIVWRWWHGAIDAVEDDLVVSRPAGDGGSTTKTVALPDGLRAAARVGEAVWFGADEEGALIAVGIAGRTTDADVLLERIDDALNG